MRLSTSVLLVSLALAAQAADQAPFLDSLLSKAKSYLSTGIPSPSQAGAAAIASQTITELTPSNWKSVLASRADEPSPQNWLIQVTGGNKTCAGKCTALDANFNKTATLLAATPDGPHLARLNCEANPALCTILFTGPPVLWYVSIPGPVGPDQTKAKTPIYVKGLNGTAGSVTSIQDMVDFHSKKGYLERPPVESAMHPFDGTLAQLGLNVPAGYVLYYMSVVPSWAVMLLVSFFTRNMMSKRMQSSQRSVHPPGSAAGGAGVKKTN